MKEYTLLFRAKLLEPGGLQRPRKETVVAESEWQAMTKLYHKYDQIGDHIIVKVEEVDDEEYSHSM